MPQQTHHRALALDALGHWHICRLFDLLCVLQACQHSARSCMPALTHAFHAYRASHAAMWSRNTLHLGCWHVFLLLVGAALAVLCILVGVLCLHAGAGCLFTQRQACICPSGKRCPCPAGQAGHERQINTLFQRQGMSCAVKQSVHRHLLARGAAVCGLLVLLVLGLSLLRIQCLDILCVLCFGLLRVEDAALARRSCNA